MKTINVKTVLEKADHDNLGKVLASLSSDTLLYVMGVVNMPELSQTVYVKESHTTGSVEDINYVEGRIRVRYDKPWVRWYKEDDSDWNFCENVARGFVVRKEGVDKDVKEWFNIEELVF